MAGYASAEPREWLSPTVKVSNRFFFSAKPIAGLPLKRHSRGRDSHSAGSNTFDIDFVSCASSMRYPARRVNACPVNCYTKVKSSLHTQMSACRTHAIHHTQNETPVHQNWSEYLSLSLAVSQM
jgi:ferredoxin-like protein FixX